MMTSRLPTYLIRLWAFLSGLRLIHVRDLRQQIADSYERGIRLAPYRDQQSLRGMRLQIQSIAAERDDLADALVKTHARLQEFYREYSNEVPMGSVVVIRLPKAAVGEPLAWPDDFPGE